MAQPTLAPQQANYKNIFMPEAVKALIIQEEPLGPDRVEFYARVLAYHVEVNNVFKEAAFFKPETLKANIDQFYETYRVADSKNKYPLLSEPFLDQLVQIDETRFKLNGDDEAYLRDISLSTNFKIFGLDLTKLTEPQKKLSEWVLRYLKAIINPETIKYNVALYKDIGAEEVTKTAQEELFVTTGAQFTSSASEKRFNVFWYTSQGGQITFKDLSELQAAREDRSKLTQITNPYILSLYAQILISPELRNKAAQLPQLIIQGQHTPNQALTTQELEQLFPPLAENQPDFTQLFNKGWYTHRQQGKITIEQTEAFLNTMQDPAKLPGIDDPHLILGYARSLILRGKFSAEAAGIFWSCKKSNLTSLITKQREITKL